MSRGYWRRAKECISETNESHAEIARGSSVDPSSVSRLVKADRPSRTTTIGKVIDYLNAKYNMGLIKQDEIEEVP